MVISLANIMKRVMKMFAICDYGSYEDYGIYCIEVDQLQKELFEKYCFDSQKVDASHGESIEFKGYSDLDYKQFVNDLKQFDLYISISYMTIKDHQEMCRKTLEYIPRHGNHYLQNRTNELMKLLKYDFS